jgi:hypothetical protein
MAEGFSVVCIEQTLAIAIVAGAYLFVMLRKWHSVKITAASEILSE